MQARLQGGSTLEEKSMLGPHHHIFALLPFSSCNSVFLDEIHDVSLLSNGVNS